MFLGNCRAGGSAPGWFGSSRSEPGEKASGRSHSGRAGTRLDWIGKEYWGMGLATQALSKFLSDIRVRPIYGRAAKDNVASIRVMEKCGFTISGSSKGFANARGKKIEEVILELSGPTAN